MPRIETSLSEDDHKAWQTFCLETGTNSAKILRTFIKHSIDNQNADAIHSAKKPLAKTLKNKKITVSFTQIEWDAIVAKIASEEYNNPTHWLRSLVMNVLYQDAVLTNKEIDTLEKLSYQLWAIGHNLNQVTRALNIDFRESHKLKLDMIQDLKDLNQETRDAFSALITKNKNRWHQQDH